MASIRINDTVVPIGEGVQSFNRRIGDITPLSGDYTAEMIGLGNVDNTSDTDKPISTATQTALNGKANTSHTHTKSQISDFPTIPTALSDLTDDTTHRVVSDTEKSIWNNKSDFSGSYNDLTNKPTSLPASDVSAWAKASTKPTYTYTEVGAMPEYTNETATGAVSTTLNPDTEYSFTEVTSLTLSPSDTLKSSNTGHGAHGFVGFASSTPTITVSGFDYSDGDTITSASAGGIWEFDVKAFNGGTYILWKKWK